MSDLVEFLLARIAEDEASAERIRQSTPIDWLEQPDGAWVPNTHALALRITAEADAKRKIVAMHGPQNSCFDEVGWDEFAAEYRRRYGQEPIAHYPRGYCPGCDGCSSAKDADKAAKATLRALSLAYADHPDYRDEWKELTNP